jgi:hypothetical protein
MLWAMVKPVTILTIARSRAQKPATPARTGDDRAAQDVLGPHGDEAQPAGAGIAHIDLGFAPLGVEDQLR